MRTHTINDHCHSLKAEYHERTVHTHRGWKNDAIPQTQTHLVLLLLRSELNGPSRVAVEKTCGDHAKM